MYFDNVFSHIGTLANRIIEDDKTLEEDGLFRSFDVKLYRIEVFFRDSEDSKTGLHIDAEINADNWHGPYKPKYIVDGDMSRCPSYRRHGIVMYFDSQQDFRSIKSKQSFVIIINQHKGNEFISKFTLEEYKNKFLNESVGI